MLEITSFPQSDKLEDRRALAARLRRTRRQAAKCGLAITASFGSFTVVTTATDRPRSVHGLLGVSIDAIEQALPAPQRKGPRPIGDDELDKIIRRVGPERLLNRLDVLTRPTQAAAE
jgi:hypothetical protein